MISCCALTCKYFVLIKKKEKNDKRRLKLSCLQMPIGCLKRDGTLLAMDYQLLIARLVLYDEGVPEKLKLRQLQDTTSQHLSICLSFSKVTLKVEWISMKFSGTDFWWCSGLPSDRKSVV